MTVAGMTEAGVPGPVTRAGRTGIDDRPGTVTAGRDRRLVLVLGLCLLVATTAYLMVFTLLGQIGESLDASRTTLSWITIATVITGTVSSALLPALGSVLGQRRVMAGALGCLAVGSVISAVAPDAGILIAGRIAASLGLAAAALAIAIVREHRSGPGLARALGGLAAFDGAAAAAGFVLGGAVEELAGADWRAVFLALAAISAVAGILAAITIPGGPASAAGAVSRRDEAVPAAPRRIDVRGALLLALGLTAALLPVTEGSTWGWASPRVIGLFAVAAAALTAWAVTALRSADPLVRLRILARPGVTAGVALFLLTAATVGVVNLTVPSFLEAPRAAGYGAGASVLGAGLDLLPFAAAITVAGYLAGRVAQRVQPQVIAVACLLTEAVALGLLAGFHHGQGQVIAGAALFGAGHGGLVAAGFVAITRSVRPADAGGASGLGSAVSGISGAVASAVITLVLAARLIRVGHESLPAAGGYTHAWLCGAALAAAGAVLISACGAARQLHHKQ
jgi:MFS family permease